MRTSVTMPVRIASSLMPGCRIPLYSPPEDGKAPHDTRHDLGRSSSDGDEYPSEN
jgi:hypothetical protein